MSFRVAPHILLQFGLSLAVASSLAAAGKPSSERPWAFAPLVAPPLPSVSDAAWRRDDLDLFVLARLEAEQLRPNPDADRLTLLRRVAYDLTGLPPTEAEMRAFLTDRSDDDAALAKVVQQYLDSPRFGERWARHWLDIVRYADSVGRTFNPPFTYAWRYRDYVIDSLNSDKPYDRFVQEQLAGDLLPAADVAQRRQNLVATGMLALGSHDLQSLSHEQFVMDSIDDQIDVTSRALLGLTISCARCHDHKYDPVSMRDYYALAGVFYSTRMLPGVAYRGQGSGYVNPEQLVVLPTSSSAQPPLAPGVHSMNDWNGVWSQGKRDIRYTTDPNRAVGVGEDEIADCPLRLKGDPHDRGPAPPRGDLKIPHLPPLARPDKQSSGRLELARWITSPRHPLTARVMTNRVWQHLLGAGLVLTADDFGANSERPSHPELLDHLAVRFQDGWSVKRLITTIMLSRTYRLASTTSSPAAADARRRDPQNQWYWRANLRRLEVEPLRDSLLVVSGRLSDERPSGIQVTGIGGKSLKTAAKSLLDFDDTCRTIYLPVLRSFVPESFSTFDFPDPCQIAGRRETTTVAPQALFFMNSRFVGGCAEETADLALAQPLRDDLQRVLWLYRRVLGRIATADERQDALRLIDAKDLDPRERWTMLAQSLFCSAEFRYVR